MSVEFPEVGKIQKDFLKAHVFQSCGATRDEILKGPQYGVDTGVVRINDSLSLVVATDPASLIPTLGIEESAWLSVHLVASDIATSGHLPQFAQFCLNLPESTRAEDFNQYWEAISANCKKLDIAITGGHTGRVVGQNSTVSGGVTMMTIAPTHQILTSDMSQPGDDLILVKEPAIISTAILALSFPQTLMKTCGKELLEKGQELFHEASAVDAAQCAVTFGIHENGVRAMHDVTECGVIGAVFEMMDAAGCGVILDKDEIPLPEAQGKICRSFGFDPLYSIGAGALLVSAAPEHTLRIVEHLKSSGFPATVIGKVKEKADGMELIEQGVSKPLVHPGVDPYWGAFFNALNEGLK